ncbi:uncharacterized protein LOC143299547 [Babylonia areolata]|uniref:uncharacterized protein LOC143299547 n=1 Tax=Babylonia areolata TaxID=304850 RepID=UPI003FD22120
MMPLHSHYMMYGYEFGSYHPGSNGGDFCFDPTRNNTRWCSHGCCGARDTQCCHANMALIVGVSVLTLLFICSVVAACCCCCLRRHLSAAKPDPVLDLQQPPPPYIPPPGEATGGIITDSCSEVHHHPHHHHHHHHSTPTTTDQSPPPPLPPPQYPNQSYPPGCYAPPAYSEPCRRDEGEPSRPEQSKENPAAQNSQRRTQPPRTVKGEPNTLNSPGDVETITWVVSCSPHEAPTSGVKVKGTNHSLRQVSRSRAHQPISNTVPSMQEAWG